MARGNQRDKAREKTQKEAAATKKKNNVGIFPFPSSRLPQYMM
jgi:hypothetical protein